jgi:predicted DNA-binding transcriptional regulator YafY
MSHSPQLIRQWTILRLLESFRNGCTIQELIDETEVSGKTIRRDLKVLQETFEITQSSKDGTKRWKMSPLAEQLGFNLTELLALHMSQQFVEPLAGTPFWQGSRSIFRKVKGALGDKGQRYIEKLSTGLLATTVGSSNYEKRGDLIDRLMIAIEDHKVALIVYQSMQSTEPVEQEVYPLGLVYHRGRLYLIAWSSRREEVRNFKVDRIDDVDVQHLQASVPQDFDLNDWLSKCFGVWRSGNERPQRIRIRFHRDAARYVQESTWHESQHIELQDDASIIATFELPDLLEIKSWILSFGPRATVLEPQSLIDDITTDLQTMQRAYEGVRQ